MLARAAFSLSPDHAAGSCLAMLLVRPNRVRWCDYTLGARANQLDYGIGDTLVLGRNRVRTAPCPCDQIHTLAVIDTFVQ